ncbi:MAG: polysaccharide biosynthesis protein, partial [Chitinophagaceae bacterium]|nr:polysaccharide biosynthesis protein [Chitinophagaceae bacterium]
ISIPVLSRAWKEKDFSTISRIYKRSSLNLLLIAVFLFSLIWLNYDNAVDALQLHNIYEQGKWVVFLLAIKNIVDMGTGVNAQIIGTSTYWRFDFFSGMILLLLIVPLNIILVKQYGIIGSAWSALISYTVYNSIRLVFLKSKFNLHPFSEKTIKVLLHSAACFILIYFLFKELNGWWGMIIRSVAYVALFIPTAIAFQLSPDIEPVMATIRKKLKL